MSTSLEASPAPPSKLAKWSGWALTGLIILANLMGAGMNVSGNEEAVKGAVEVGYPADTLFGIGVAVLISTLVFAVPKTAVLGAILLTGYMGGAVATHIRAGQGWGTTIPAFVFAALVWVAMLLREPRLRALLPVRKE
jgi:hypothetical protein